MAKSKLDAYTLATVSSRLSREARHWTTMSLEPRLSDEVEMRRRSIANILRSVAADFRDEARSLTSAAKKKARK